MTDWLLYDLSERNSKVLYKAFSRHEESHESGADWEWWFLFDKYRLRFRIQAKRATSLHKDLWGELVKSNKRGLQIEMLLDSARKNNAYPLYAFYTDLASQSMCEGQSDVGSPGVFVASAERLHQMYLTGSIKRPVRPVDVLKMSTPFNCFACCGLVDVGGDMLRFLQYYFGSASAGGDSFESNLGFYGIDELMPRYVEDLLLRPSVANMSRNSDERDPPDIHGVVVVDLRMD